MHAGIRLIKVDVHASPCYSSLQLLRNSLQHSRCQETQSRPCSLQAFWRAWCALGTHLPTYKMPFEQCLLLARTAFKWQLKYEERVAALARRDKAKLLRVSSKERSDEILRGVSLVSAASDVPAITPAEPV